MGVGQIGLLNVTWKFVGSDERRFRFINTSSSDHCCKSCVISAGRGGVVRFFQSKHACLAFFQYMLLGKLVVPKYERVFFGFLPISASKADFWVTPCCVIRNVFIISATSEASLYGVFGCLFSLLLIYALVFQFFSTPIVLWSTNGAKIFLCYLCCKRVKLFGPKHLGLVAP